MPAMPTDLVAWCEALEVTQGDHEGELLTLLDWERDFLRSVEASAGGELGLSVPAGAGKPTYVRPWPRRALPGRWRSA